MPSEFDLIRRFFSRPTHHTELAGGDDGALIQPGNDQQLVVSSDMLVEGVHFFADVPPFDLGWKTLAVNVSDLAAMGALPRWATLALALPRADEEWLHDFARGFYACADTFGVDLVGGDTTRGPLNLCVTIFGELPHGTAIRRDGARIGDEIWITGQPGRAALGLAALQGRLALPAPLRGTCIAALQRPQPRVAAGLALRDIATAMLDVSDGLIGDLRHILQRSQVGARLEGSALPWPTTTRDSGLPPEHIHRALLHGGDDYELLFTAPSAQHQSVAELAHTLNLPLHCIGVITPQQHGLSINGFALDSNALGYDHFR